MEGRGEGARARSRRQSPSVGRRMSTVGPVVVIALSQTSEPSTVKRTVAQGAALAWTFGPQEG